MVCAHELGLADRIELVPAKASPVDRNTDLGEHGPLLQVPLLVSDEGDGIYDSRVICEHLDAVASGSLFGAGPSRVKRLTEAALGDGLLNAALLNRYEATLRPAELRWDAWQTGQIGKVRDALRRFERDAGALGERVDIGTITLGCALGYLDFRYGDLAWRDGHPGLARWYDVFSERPSMSATAPQG